MIEVTSAPTCLTEVTANWAQVQDCSDTVNEVLMDNEGFNGVKGVECQIFSFSLTQYNTGDIGQAWADVIAASKDHEIHHIWEDLDPLAESPVLTIYCVHNPEGLSPEEIARRYVSALNRQYRQILG